MTLPSTMRAARIHRYGPPEVLQIESVPMPTLGPDDVLVEVHAAAINVVDCKIRSGRQAGVVRLSLPWTLGLDVSGVVAAIGTSVRRFQVGDAVYGSPPHTRPGTYAEYVAVAADVLALKPARLSHIEAAGVPLVALTAWEALEVGDVAAGQQVLIVAGAGGVGTMAIQLAKVRGAIVTTAARPSHAALLRSLGADKVVDFEREDLWAQVHDLDFALCNVGHGDRERALQAVRRGGTIVSLVADIPTYADRYGPTLGAVVAGARIGAFLVRARLTGRRAFQLTRSGGGRMLQRIAPWLESGVVRPVIDEVFPFEQVVAAHRACEAGGASGKLILQVR